MEKEVTPLLTHWSYVLLAMTHRYMYIYIWYKAKHAKCQFMVSCIIAHMMTSSNGNIFRVTGHLCGDPPVPGEFTAQRQVTRSFDVFFDLCLIKRLSKHSRARGWWFETQSRPSWRHCNGFRAWYYQTMVAPNWVFLTRRKIIEEMENDKMDLFQFHV